MRNRERRATAQYLALLVLAVVVFQWKTLLTDQFTQLHGFEIVNQTYAWLHFWLRSIRSGHIPMWDPYVFAGRPFTEEMAAFYPIHLLFALIPLNHNELISPRFFHEYLAFNRLLGACFIFALLRELRRSHFAAFIGACAFTMGGMLSELPWPQYQESCIWLPAIFLFLLRALQSEQRSCALAEAALGGLCMGMTVLAGGIQFAMIQGVFITTAVIYYAAVSPARRDRAYWLRMGAILGVLLMASFGAGAAQLLPSFEFGPLSMRSISGGWFPTSQKIPWDRLVSGNWPESIVTGLFPTGGATSPTGEAWPPYIGVFPFFLVVTAIWKCWSNLWVRFFSVMALIVFAYSLGEFSPLFGVLYAAAPLLWMARSASRFTYLISFTLPALCAFGLDALLDGAGKPEVWARSRPFLKWIAIVCGAAVFLPAVFNQLTPGIWPCFSLLFIIGSCSFFFRLTLRAAPASLRIALAAFILFDLGTFNWHDANKNDLAKTGDDYVEIVTLRQAADFVRAQPGLHRALVSVATLPDIGDIYGIPGLWGGGATVLTDYSRLRPHEDLLNVGFHIKPVSTPDPGAIYQDTHWKVYRDKNEFPRAWLVHQVIVEPSHDAAFLRLDKPGIDLHNVAVVEKRLPQGLDADASGDSVVFQSWAPDKVSLTVNAAHNGLLVLSEVWYPGWRATVNGRPAEIYKTDGSLRGIVVPAGSSQVALSFQPMSFYLGASLTLATFVCVLAGRLWLRLTAFQIS